MMISKILKKASLPEEEFALGYTGSKGYVPVLFTSSDDKPFIRSYFSDPPCVLTHGCPLLIFVD